MHRDGSGLPPVPTPQGVSHPRAKLNSSATDFQVHCAIQPDLWCLHKQPISFFSLITYGDGCILILSHFKRKQRLFLSVIIQEVYKFFAFEAESTPKAPLPRLPLLGQLSIQMGGGVTGRDLRFTKCFMLPRSRKRANLLPDPLSLSLYMCPW